MCGNEYDCDHFSFRDGAWSGGLPKLARPLKPGWTSAVIGILDTVFRKEFVVDVKIGIRIIIFNQKVWYVTGYDVSYRSKVRLSFIFGHSSNTDKWIYGPEYPLAVDYAFAIQVSMEETLEMMLGVVLSFYVLFLLQITFHRYPAINS